MQTVLVIFLLSVQSSYVSGTEIPATTDVFDTVQFFSSNGRNWRIKTYATDQDVHIWSLGPDIVDIATLALTNTKKYYGDVLYEGYIIETEEGFEGLRRELTKRNLSAHLELPPSGAIFWAPQDSHYRTKSVPK